MNPLYILSPAEILVIQKGRNAPLKELLKVTLMDLVLKNVLQITETPNIIRGNLYIYKHVIIGSNFHNHTPLKHEHIFLSGFLKNNMLQIIFREIVMIPFENFYSAHGYQSKIINQPSIKKYFNSNLLSRFFRGLTLSNIGIEVKKQLKKDIADIQQQLDTAKRNHLNTNNITEPLKGNIYFFDIMLDNNFQLFDETLYAEINKKPPLFLDSDSSYWDRFDNDNHYFNS